MSFRYFIAVSLLTLLPFQASAQQEPIFKDYDTMRAELDGMMKAREIKAAMQRFGGARSMSDEEVGNLETRMREIYPYDFRNVAVIDRKEMQNGFAQEMYAYWTGLRYLYVLVFLHQKEDQLVSINIRFNTDFYALISDF